MLFRFRPLENSDRPLVFFHIMKTGGTTLRGFLEHQFHIQEICPYQHWYQWEPDQAPGYRLYIGHFLFSQIASLGPGWWVTVLRHPVERVISEYLHWRRTYPDFFRWNPAYRPLRELALKYDLISFVEREEESGFPIANRQAYQLGLPEGWPYAKPTPPPKRILEQARENLLRFHWVGVTEHLDQMVELLALFWGWRPPYQIPVLRVRHEDIELSTRARRRLEQLTALDMELYFWARAWQQEQWKQVWRSYAGEIPSKEKRRHLLEKRYARVYTQRFPRPHLPLHWTCASPVNGDGWLPRWTMAIAGQRRLVCWSGPGPRAFLDLPVPQGISLQIRLRVAAFAVPRHKVSLLVEGRRYPLEWSQEGEIWIGETRLPPQREQLPFLRLVVDTQHTAPVHPPFAGPPVSGGVALLGVDILPAAQKQANKKVGMEGFEPSRHAGTGS